MKLHIGSNGFGILGVILIIAIFAVVGGAGWYVWDRQNDGDNKQSINTQTTEKIGEPIGDEVKSISFGTMGVKFIPPKSIETLLYAESLNEAGVEYVAFSSRELMELEQNNKCDIVDSMGEANSYHLGLLFKVEGEYPTIVTDENSYGLLVKQFDDYNLQYRKPSEDCFDIEQNQNYANSMGEELIEALKSTLQEE